jgi:hypothetical protein
MSQLTPYKLWEEALDPDFLHIEVNSRMAFIVHEGLDSWSQELKRGYGISDPQRLISYCIEAGIEVYDVR